MTSIATPTGLRETLAARALQGGILGWRVRSRLLRALAPRRTVHTRGLAFTLQCDNWITYYRWRTYNTKEPETLDWIDASLRPGDVFLDVGANIGVYSLYASRRRPSVRVLAIEPEFSNLHLLRDNVIANALEQSIDIFGLALGATSGLTFLEVHDPTPAAAYHCALPVTTVLETPERTVGCREGVAMLTLDRFCDAMACEPSLIKIDTDGGEVDILTGAHATLRSPALRSVLIEMPPDAGERARCEALLATAGLVEVRRPSASASANAVWGRNPGVS